MRGLAGFTVVALGVALAGLGGPALAADKADAQGEVAGFCSGPAGQEPSGPAQAQTSAGQASVTTHTFSAGGKTFDYIATAGLLVIRGDDGKPLGELSYVAYTRPPHKGEGPRPVLFAFNGGPGSSAALLNVGMLGPVRAVVADAGPTPPAPYKMADNPYTMLDKTDLVMIDPISTGLSRALCGHKDKEFWTVDADIDATGRFIAQYVSDNNRWTSPKYLLGESYGTIRAATVADYLRARRAMDFNGVILLSVATDIELLWPAPGNDRPYATYLPAYAAVAWYHHKVPNQPSSLLPFLEAARQFASGPYTAALMKGSTISDEEKDSVALQMSRFIGLSPDYIKQANLRISNVAFGQELLRNLGLIVARLDGRFAGLPQDSQDKEAGYDPILADVVPVYTAAFQDYYHQTLKFGIGRDYRPTNFDVGNNWTWSHRPIGAGEDQPLVNADVDLAQEMIQDPNVKVLVLNGYFDTGSSFFASEYMMSHLAIPKSEMHRVTMKYYMAGHLIYVSDPALQRLKADLDAFIQSSH